jgi:hypothetical protein
MFGRFLPSKETTEKTKVWIPTPTRIAAGAQHI